MKLNKKTERLIKRRAAEFKKLYETPNPEVDKIISELRAEATKRPQNMSKEEEIAYVDSLVPLTGIDEENVLLALMKIAII